jgi:hypothetical protein
MKRKPKHHRTQRGARVRVLLHDGTVITGKFDEQSTKFCKLQDHARIPWVRVASFSRWGPDRVRSDA